MALKLLFLVTVFATFRVGKAVVCPGGLNCPNGFCCTRRNNGFEEIACCDNALNNGPHHALYEFATYRINWGIIIASIIISIILSILISLLCCCLVPGCLWYRRGRNNGAGASYFGGSTFPFGGGTIIFSPEPPHPSWIYNHYPETGSMPHRGSSYSKSYPPPPPTYTSTTHSDSIYVNTQQPSSSTVSTNSVSPNSKSVRFDDTSGDGSTSTPVKSALKK